MAEAVEEAMEEEFLEDPGYALPLEGGDEILPLHSAGGAATFQPYVLDIAGAPMESDGAALALALVVLLRGSGMLLALPELAMSAATLSKAQIPIEGEFVGPSTKVTLPLAIMDEENLPAPPRPVDFGIDAGDYLRLVQSAPKLEAYINFDPLVALHVPLLSALVNHALNWVGAASMDAGDRLQFYSADEALQTPQAVELPKKPVRRRGPGAGTTGGAEAQKPVKPRVTVAQLAQSLDDITRALPI